MYIQLLANANANAKIVCYLKKDGPELDLTPSPSPFPTQFSQQTIGSPIGLPVVDDQPGYNFTLPPPLPNFPAYLTTITYHAYPVLVSTLKFGKSSFVTNEGWELS